MWDFSLKPLRTSNNSSRASGGVVTYVLNL